VELDYKMGEDTDYLSPNGSSVSLRQDLRAVFRCTAIMEGGDPNLREVVISLDGVDVTREYTQHITRLFRDDKGLALRTLTYQYFRRIEMVQVDLHGKNLTCTAVREMFAPLSASLMIYVNHRPEFDCSAGWATPPGRAGYFEISCLARMHPGPRSVCWSWLDSRNQTVSILDGQISEEEAKGYQAGQAVMGGGQYTLSLMFVNIKPSDYKRYLLEVVNDEGTGFTSVQLDQEIVEMNKPHNSHIDKRPMDEDIQNDEKDVRELADSGSASTVYHTSHLLLIFTLLLLILPVQCLPSCMTLMFSLHTWFC